METITYDLLFHNELIKPGSLLKIKGKWKLYAYIHILCLGDINDTWIICEDNKGNRERFKPGQIKKIMGKRSYQKCLK